MVSQRDRHDIFVNLIIYKNRFHKTGLSWSHHDRFRKEILPRNGPCQPRELEMVIDIRGTSVTEWSPKGTDMTAELLLLRNSFPMGQALLPREFDCWEKIKFVKPGCHGPNHDWIRRCLCHGVVRDIRVTAATEWSVSAGWTGNGYWHPWYFCHGMVSQGDRRDSQEDGILRRGVISNFLVLLNKNIFTLCRV